MRFLKYLRRRFPDVFDFVNILFLQGFRGYVDFARNSKLLWSVKSLDGNFSPVGVSSISDGTEYVGVCRLAVEDDKVFVKFKSCAEYRSILEHCDFSQGREYLKMLRGNTDMVSNLRKIAELDNGKPFTYHYRGLGQVSPTQIRYAKILQDIETLFGSVNNLNIAEIGVGYGGQAIHILSRWSPKNYFVYDLEWPARLMLKNLERCRVGLSIQPMAKNWKEPVSCDLLISNYAFSELFSDIQEIYFENIVKNSKAGYVIYNHIHDNATKSMTAEEFAARIPGSIILKEEPITFPGNVLVVWGQKV